MNLTNASYTILLHGKTWTERYFREESGWIKQSARGRQFRATAEQVLNHLLPPLAGLKSSVTVEVEHHETPPGRREAGLRREAERPCGTALGLAGKRPKR